MGWRSFRTMSQIRSRAAKIEIYEPSVAVWAHRDSKFGEFSEGVPAPEVKLYGRRECGNGNPRTSDGVPMPRAGAFTLGAYWPRCEESRVKIGIHSPW